MNGNYSYVEISFTFSTYVVTLLDICLWNTDVVSVFDTVNKIKDSSLKLEKLFKMLLICS